MLTFEMKSALVSVVAMFGLAACGPDFTGHWVGNLNETGSCSDGSGIPSNSNPVDWTISEQGSTLTIVTFGNCGTFSADDQGGTATFLRKDCPQLSDPSTGVTKHQHIIGGTASLNGSTMAVTIQSVYDVRTPSASGTCNATATGVLGRQQ